MSFTESNCPGNVFLLGGDVFMFCGVFRNTIIVHVRRYNKYRECYYPTKEGITLSVFQFVCIVSNNYLRLKTIEKPRDDPLYEFFQELPLSLDPIIVESSSKVFIRDRWQDNVIYINFSENGVSLQEDDKYRSGQSYSRTLVLNNEQWERIFEFGNAMLDIIWNIEYSSLTIHKLYELIYGLVTKEADPDQDYTCINSELYFIFQCKLYEALEKKGLSNPEVEKNTLQRFNIGAISLNLFDIVKAFYENVKEKECIHLVTREFLNSVNMIVLLRKACHDFCII